jgi:hypothetical protein
VPFGKQVIGVLHIEVVIAGLEFYAVVEDFVQAVELPVLCDADGHHGGIPLGAKDGHFL